MKLVVHLLLAIPTLFFLHGPACGGADSLIRETDLAEFASGSVPSEIRISSDGRRIMQLVMNEGKCFISVNGAMSAAYDGITKDSMHFSTDGSRYCYGAAIGDRRFVVVDGHEYPAFEGCAEGMPFFSPDGQHFAYIILRDRKVCVALDGEPGPMFDVASKVPPLFSPDGKRFAYLGKDSEGAFVMLDGIRSESFDNIAAIAFSPDSQHFAFIAITTNSMALLVDGREVYRDAHFVKGSLGFDGANELHVLNRSEGRIVRIQVEVPDILKVNQAENRSHASPP